MSAATTSVHPAYQQLASLLFGQNFAQMGEKTAPRGWDTITLADEAVVNGNRHLPEGTVLYTKKPASK